MNFETTSSSFFSRLDLSIQSVECYRCLWFWVGFLPFRWMSKILWTKKKSLKKFHLDFHSFSLDFSRRLKEIMRIMGLKDTVHWFTWFVLCTTVMMFSAFLLVVLLKVTKNFMEKISSIDTFLFFWSSAKLLNILIFSFYFCFSSVIHLQRLLNVFSSAFSSIEQI